MDQNFLALALGIAIGAFISYLITKIYFHLKLKDARKKSVRQSRSVILGEVSEKIVPVLPNFHYHTKDMVFIGKGIDYLVFDGLSEGRLKDIIFLEIKSGKSQLNKNEQMIKQHLDYSSVKYEVVRIKH